MGDGSWQVVSEAMASLGTCFSESMRSTRVAPLVTSLTMEMAASSHRLILTIEGHGGGDCVPAAFLVGETSGIFFSRKGRGRKPGRKLINCDHPKEESGVVVEGRPNTGHTL